MISFDRINKKLYNHKALNLVTFCFALFFVFYAIMISVVKVGEQNEFDFIYNQMISDATTFNALIDDENSDDGEEIIDDTPLLFSNAKQAVLTAWDKYESYTTFEMKSSAVITSNTPIGVITMLSSIVACQFEDETQYNALINFEGPGSNQGKTEGKEFYYANGNRYSRTTKNVTKSGDNLTA
jgi:hypothetical protein